MNTQKSSWIMVLLNANVYIYKQVNGKV